MKARYLAVVFVLATALGFASSRPALAACGDGVVNPGEQCDLGPGNGSALTCCTTLCEFRAEDNVCRPAADACDVRELCLGTSAICPPDVVIPEGASCDDSSTCTVDDRCSEGVCSGTPSPDTCIDDFTCYKVRTTPGTPRFTPVSSVHLVDQFEDVNFRVMRTRQLCTPSDKNGEGTLDPATHGKNYFIRTVSGSPRHVPRRNIRVTNQIGSLRLDTVKPDLLFVPTAKDLTSPPAPPNPTSHLVDHYKCYRIRITPRTPRFPNSVFVTYTDQFSGTSRTLRLKKPRHLCTPVDKNGEGIKNPQIHLMCYSAGGTPRHQRRTGLYVNDQFGLERLDTNKEGEFCIPSVKSLSPSGAFLD